ncbi:unnamed protein product [Leptosia nina]|uniref:Peptidase S1 domain-containing protein n=1 Tax=Leptosia nina TaxID=320188 RepID=A0AAV1J3L7_9NEOP
MNALVVLVYILPFIYGEEWPLHNSAYGYLTRYAIPLGEKIRKAEEAYIANGGNARIVGGVPSDLGRHPYQVGIISDILDTNNMGVCGGSLISANRVLTAAHCWFDGTHLAWRFTIVLGSVFLFSGGTRIQSRNIALHPLWSPELLRNDIGVIYLPHDIQFSAYISPVALPSKEDEEESFSGIRAIASGYGITADGQQMTISQDLNHVQLTVIRNEVCAYYFPSVIQDSHLCTSSLGGASICIGDTGGPLVIERNGQSTLIGVASFVSNHGCQKGIPASFTRVTSYLGFIKEHS